MQGICVVLTRQILCENHDKRKTFTQQQFLGSKWKQPSWDHGHIQLENFSKSLFPVSDSFVVSWLSKSNWFEFLGNVINYICYEICCGIFACKLPVYLLMALSCLSLFCCVYPWSFNFTFVLFAINTWFQIIWAFNEMVKHVRVLSFWNKNVAITFFPPSVTHFSPAFVKLIPMRTNDSSLQLLCLSASPKSFAALSVNLLHLRSNNFSLQLLCLSASPKSFVALSVNLWPPRRNDFSFNNKA